MRKLDTKLHTLSRHEQHVIQVNWSPDNPTVLASSSADHRVHIWDLGLIGEDQSAEDAEDGPPELLASFKLYFSLLMAVILTE